MQQYLPALGWSDVIAIFAFVASMVSLLISIWAAYRRSKDSYIQHVRTVWNDLLKTCAEHPEYLNRRFAESYQTTPEKEQMMYAAFNYQAWYLVQLVISSRLWSNARNSSIIQWIVAHHKPWLDENPFFFKERNFWDIVDNIDNNPVALFRSRTPPMKNTDISSHNDLYQEDIDWDSVCVKYDEHILGPFADEMVKPINASEDKIRNKLLMELNNPEYDLSNMRVADFGCGPGNLLPHVKGKVKQIYGIDYSNRCLEIAKERASELNIDFIAKRADMRTYRTDEKYDLIVSVNSILPRDRKDIGKILRNIAYNLSDNGTFLAILPSFDTTVALRRYWREEYLRQSGDERFAEKCDQAFVRKKKIDEIDLKYSDDGIHVQCFHTLDSIRKDYDAAALVIEREPEKILYPWELAQKFDYGHFPDRPEIWDWFVIAKAPVVT